LKQEPKSLAKFGTNSSDPAITLPDVAGAKKDAGQKATNYFSDKLSTIKQEYDNLMNLANDTEMVNKAQIQFEPKSGFLYHLYEREDGSQYISLISPEEWGKPMNHMGSCVFFSDGTWVRQ
jgi:hypothetical protein